MYELIIHHRVLKRHPQLTEKDVRTAWENAYYEALRPDSPNFPEYPWIGIDSNGREIEMVGGSHSRRLAHLPRKHPSVQADAR